MPDDGGEEVPAIDDDPADPFLRRFPGVVSGAVPMPMDLEPIRAQLLSAATNLRENTMLLDDTSMVVEPVRPNPLLWRKCMA